MNLPREGIETRQARHYQTASTHKLQMKLPCEGIKTGEEEIIKLGELKLQMNLPREGIETRKE
ncbi:hypothetical protein E7T06_05310 [Deinococcus sp. Arct2-2]|nr:hypothetical protein E7T06_05310 [Deinococcus sp. Arct2-2]